MAVVYRNPHEQSSLVAQEELAAIQQERKDLTERLAWIDNRVKQLEAYLQAIAPLIENDPGRVAAEAGLTNICRDILGKLGRWMGATEMRVLLVGSGVDISTYTNPMAVLHSVLKRVGQTYKDPVSGNLLYGPKGIPAPVFSPTSALDHVSYPRGNTLMDLGGSMIPTPPISRKSSTPPVPREQIKSAMDIVAKVIQEGKKK